MILDLSDYNGAGYLACILVYGMVNCTGQQQCTALEEAEFNLLVGDMEIECSLIVVVTEIMGNLGIGESEIEKKKKCSENFAFQGKFKLKNL